MLRVSNKQSEEYVNRQGQVILPGPDDRFFDRSGAFVICRAEDRVLSIKAIDGEGLWELPGGGVDDGESPEDAVLRETYEETGFDLSADYLRHLHSQKAYLHVAGRGFWNYQQNFFLIDDPALSDHMFDGIKTSPEEGEMAWVHIDEMKDLRYKHFVDRALRILGFLEAKDRIEHV
ncbi:MAG: NUDIX hydrolase [Pseudomonadota bacterium]